MSCWRAAAVLIAGGALGCAVYALRVPDSVRGYEIVVDGQDTLSRAFARALTDAGLKVRPAPRGGMRPAAVLVHFVFRGEQDGVAYLYVRLADTRTGQVVASAEQPLDSLMGAGPRAAALVRVLLIPRS